MLILLGTAHDAGGTKVVESARVVLGCCIVKLISTVGISRLRGSQCLHETYWRMQSAILR